MELEFFGYIILLMFVIFMLQMINEGPFIFKSGNIHYVNIKEMKFDIEKLVIKKGDTVVWTNYDQFRHTVINDSPSINKSDILYEYDKYMHTFNSTDTIKLRSSLYKNMPEMIIYVQDITKGKSFYNEIINNISIFIKKIISTFIFHIKNINLI